MAKTMMQSSLDSEQFSVSLRTRIKHYKKMAQEIERYLLKRPNEWGRFQSEFNAEVNNVFREIMDFEKTNLIENREDRVYKLKRLFVNKLQKIFLRGQYIVWSLDKPYGYAGDYKIINDIYLNNPASNGFDRLFDNYFQMSAISVSVRNRKDDFKRLILELINKKKNQPIRIMDLASGPCREVYEILSSDESICKNVVFDCFDNDINALDFGKSLLANFSNINFIKENAVRIAVKKDISAMIDKKYDLVYSTGLVDYFDERIATRLIQNLKKLLKPEGILAISDVRDKYSNPSVHFMEWVGDWNLIYRDDENFRKIFVNAGFKETDLSCQYEQQGILQYIIASNK